MADSQDLNHGPASFVQTRWSVVLAAKDKSSPDCASALDSLCQTYWYPIYAFVRRQGRSCHDAQDLTQEFFARLIQKDYLQAAAPERGRFRTFLKVALKRFLAKEWERGRALKRGGPQPPIALEMLNAEERFRLEPSDLSTPEHIYERRWAMTLLEEVLGRLQTEYVASSKAAEFQTLKGALTAARGSIPYAELAEAVGMSEGAARVAVHRMRKRFRELFREAVADTVRSPEEVEDELRHVAGILSQI